MKYIVLLLALGVMGCKDAHIDFTFAKPWDFTMEAPPGPPMYQQAYKDGCESGYSGYGNSTNVMFWEWKQDPELTKNNVYYQMWKDAYAYCALVGMMADEHGFGNWR